MSFKEYLEESPVGSIGRTTQADAEAHVTPALEKEFMAIVKKMGGKTVARLMLNKINSKGDAISDKGDKSLTSEACLKEMNFDKIPGSDLEWMRSVGMQMMHGKSRVTPAEKERFYTMCDKYGIKYNKADGTVEEQFLNKLRSMSK